MNKVQFTYILILSFLPAVFGKAKNINLLRNSDFSQGQAHIKVPSWIKNTIEPEFITENNRKMLTFRGIAGKCGYVMWTVNPMLAKKYIFTVAARSKSSVGNWYPKIMLEILYKVDGRTKFKYFYGKKVGKNNNKDTLYQVTAIPPENTFSVRAILQTTKLAAKHKNAGKISFYKPKLIAIPPENNKIQFISVVPAEHHGIYKLGEKAHINLRVLNGYNTPKTTTVNYRIINFFDYKESEAQKTFNLSPLSTMDYLLPIKLPRRFGFFGIKCEINFENGLKTEKTASIIIVKPSPKTDPFFTMCHFAFPLDYMAPVRSLGCGVSMISFFRLIEKTPGKYIWTKYDQRLKHLLKNGFKVVGMLPVYGCPRWFMPSWLNIKLKEGIKNKKNPHTKQYYVEFRKFIVAVLERYGKHIHEWSIVNEIDLTRHYNPYEVDHYVKCTRIIHEELKKRYPHAPLGGLGVSGVDCQEMLPYAQKLWPRVKDYLDELVLDAHTIPCVYGLGYSPITEERARLRDILLKAQEIAKKSGKKSISIEEKGYLAVSTMPPDDKHLKDQAAVMARGVIIARSVPSVKRWVPFLGVSNSKSITDYGMWRKGCPRPILAAYSMVAHFLSFAENPIEVKPMGDIYCYLFNKGKQTVGAIWTTAKNPVKTKIILPADCKIFDLMGNPVKRSTVGNCLTLTTRPLFLQSSTSQAKLAAMVKKATYFLPKIAGELVLLNSNTVQVVLRNKTIKPLPVQLSTHGKVFKRLTLPAGKLVRIPMRLNSSIVTGEGKEICVNVKAENEKYPLSKYFSPLPVVRLKHTPKLDGSLNTFKGVTPVNIDNVNYLLPVDAAANGLWKGIDDLSFKVYLAYDEKYFYIGASVTDDVSCFFAHGVSLWAQDAFQISIDPQNNALTERLAPPGYNSDDWDYAFGHSRKGPQIYCYKSAYNNSKFSKRLVPFKLVTKRVSSTAMNYELAIPWTGLAPLKPIPEKVFGFNIGMFDSDNDESAVYSMALTGGTTNGKSPSSYKKFMLMP